MRILIVEDSSADRELLLELLQQNFMTEAKFREAYNLSMALDYLSQWDFDCVLLDLNLPDSVGWDTFQDIHISHPRIPIVVVTHNKSQKLALQLIREGACDVIVKDYTDPTTVFQRILFAVERDHLAKVQETRSLPRVKSEPPDEDTDPGMSSDFHIKP